MPESAPMIQLGEGGSAPVLSYQVPDSTSFAGRHYLEIDTPLEHFLDAGPSIQVSTARPEKGAKPIKTGGVREFPAVYTRTVAGDASLPLAPGRFSESLARVTAAVPAAVPASVPAAVVAASPTVTAPALAPDVITPAAMPSATITVPATHAPLLGGTGTPVVMFGVSGDTGGPEGTITETPLDRQGDAASGGADEQVKANLIVLAPANGASFAAGAAGVDLTVRGRVNVTPTSATYPVPVTCKIDGVTAAVFSQTVTDTFSFVLPHVQPGSHTLTFTYKPTKGSPAIVPVTRTFVVTPAGAGSVAPALEVLAPTAGTVVVDAATGDGVEYGAVSVRCRATHPSGIAKVTVAAAGLEAIPLTAGTGANASAYSGTVDLLGYGSHTLVITATATSGEKAELSVPVKLTDKAPGSYLYSRLMLVQRVQLTTRLGDYGAGRIVKTFSMLPGERMTVSVKTYRRSTVSEKRASTIFDGVEDTTADEFTNAVDSENNNKAVTEDSLSWEIKAKVEQGWGSGKASLSAGLNGAHNASLETFSKNVMKAASKHAASASAKRTMEVNAESQTQTESGEEETITREIANINQSRTLNFVFRQMNQEFISVLHLVDVRIAYAAFYRRTDTGELHVEYREATIAQLDSFLRGALVPDAVPATHAGILAALEQVADYKDHLEPLIERVVPTRTVQGAEVPVPELAYWRVRRDLRQTWTDPTTGAESTVAGIVLSGDVNVMRTDGVIVDAVLGGGEALDRFSRDLQAATVDAREAEAAQLNAQAKRTQLGTKIVTDNDAARAEVWATVTPPPVAPPTDHQPA